MDYSPWVIIAINTAVMLLGFHKMSREREAEKIKNENRLTTIEVYIKLMAQKIGVHRG